MTENPGQRIDALRERIQAGEEISSADQETLLAFSDRLRLLSSRYSDHRHEHLLRRCVRMAEEVGGLADALEERSAAEELVKWIHREYDNEETNRDYRGSLRVFGKRSGEDDELPESIEWIPGSTSRNYKPKPKPGEMLHWDEDVFPMIDACRYARDEAMVAVAWDAGARSGEFRDLQLRDVSDHPNGLRITVDGKTGQRTITLIPSVPYLQRWLAEHPADDPSAPLWSKLHSPEDLSYQAVRKTLNEAAERAGVHKPVTLTNFRKSSASYLASQGLNQAVLEEHHGWSRGSRVASRYVSVFADASDREIARAHGLDVEKDEPDPTAPMTCPRCNRETPRENPACMWCGQSQSHEATQRIEEQREAALKSSRIVPEEVADAIQTIERFMGDDGGIRAAGFDE
ncbi:site-specific integrase [Halalkalicoccus sp. NIPERK01]|uniref:tyrosine-type recombinase/integrase n=1 Tax=Halalkalicoccus sp. NIPERK01 TaxID=3053469 RepID=UPI00256F5139|nr:site-specific integrase [Halalkalicoccus sp. NIPERK01]MDL5361310.1 site-specific integrase [Halalkalicoccus sp. NIPERK01]